MNYSEQDAAIAPDTEAEAEAKAEAKAEAAIAANTAPGADRFSIYQISSIMGISRSALRHYADLDMVSPAYTDSEYNYRYYDLGQIDEVRLAKIAFDSGQKGAVASAYFSEQGIDLDALLAQANSSAAEIMRNTRHLMKDIAYCQRAIKRMDAIGLYDGFYLRYMPTRVVAVIADVAQGSDTESHLKINEYLRRVARACGWSSTLLDGTLYTYRNDEASRQARPNHIERCLFLELSSPPAPQLTRAIGGGCYRMAAGFSDCAYANTEACASCARAGDAWPSPLPAAIAAASTAHHITLHVDNLSAPYLSGPWAPFTQYWMERKGAGDEPGQKTAPPPQDDIPAFRPLRMPSVYKLPAEVTAAALPEGLYLCKQHNNAPAERMACKQELIEACLQLRDRSLSPEEEIALVGQFNEKRMRTIKKSRQANSTGPATELFFKSNCRVDAEPTFGLRKLGQLEQLEQNAAAADVKLALGTIFGNEGFHLIDHKMMFSHQPHHAVFEMQVAVHGVDR